MTKMIDAINTIEVQWLIYDIKGQPFISIVGRHMHFASLSKREVLAHELSSSNKIHSLIII